MTKKEAKSELMQIYMSLSEEKKQALDVLMAQADGDLISRQAVLDALEVSYLKSEIDDTTYQRIRDLPTVAIPSAESKTGHWIEEDMFDGDVAYRCSECDELFWLEDGTPKDNGYNFCPKCGKRLVEPQESEGLYGRISKL